MQNQSRRLKRSDTRGFLRKCQPPACSGFPGGNTRQERLDAVSGREDGKHREDNREGNSGTKEGSKSSAVLRNVRRQEAMVPWEV